MTVTPSRAVRRGGPVSSTLEGVTLPPADPEPAAGPVRAAADVPLTGFTVGVTAARRCEELTGLLERRGARVVIGPAIRIVPLPDDDELHAVTRQCLQRPLDIVVGTTGIGWRGWMEAADGWGLGDALRERFAATRLLARGPKARGAIRASGLTDEWSPASESMSEVLEHLLAEDIGGLRIAVQLHGEPLPDLVQSLVEAGAEVVTIPVYRWELPADTAPLRRLVEATISRQLDAVTFTSAPAVSSMLRIAAEGDRERQLLDAFRSDVVPFCVGPVTARPLEDRDVVTVQPARARLGALVREVAAQLPQRRAKHLRVAGHEVTIRGYQVVVDDTAITPAPTPMALLKVLARQPGRVLSRAQLLQQVPGLEGDEHAVEVAVARLRTSLADPRLVQTVVKRGYRLAYDPEETPEPGAPTDGRHA
jgi:uroporphyrinogen-III synthase